MADDLSLQKFVEALQNAPLLKFGDIDFSAEERTSWDQYILFTIIDIVVTHGGPKLEHFRKELEKEQPVSAFKIPPHKTGVHPLPTFHIDESSIVGNSEVVDAILKELGIDQTSPDFVEQVRLFAGDQLSISRLRSIIKQRAGNEGGPESYAWIVVIMGLFHMKMAANQGILETFFGKDGGTQSNPASLASHNAILGRLPISIKSPPPFRVTQDLIFHSLYARILHCCLLVSNSTDLADFANKVDSFDALKAYAQKLMTTYLNPIVLHTSRATDETKDDVFESGILFLRDALILRQFTHAIKHGDSGRVLLTLRVFAFACRGNGRSKYAHELLFVIHNMTSVWPESLRYADGSR